MARKKKTIIEVKPVPDKPKKGNEREGTSTGMSVYEYLAFLFAENESIASKRKKDKGLTILTDEAIKELVQEEFPNCGTFNRTNVNTYRTKYNNGTLLRREGTPKRTSNRYDVDGNKLEKYGKRVGKNGK